MIQLLKSDLMSNSTNRPTRCPRIPGQFVPGVAVSPRSLVGGASVTGSRAHALTESLLPLQHLNDAPDGRTDGCSGPANFRSGGSKLRRSCLCDRRYAGGKRGRTRRLASAVPFT